MAANKTETRKFNVTINSVEGTCNTSLFKKMCERGDLNALRVKDHVGDIIKISGTASVTIETDDNTFDINYYATDKGVYSTGSTIFSDSVDDYIGECDTFRIIDIKTKKGITYKASPIFDDTAIETIN
jgi:hypothetical protein